MLRANQARGWPVTRAKSSNRKHQITRHPWRTSPPLRPSLSFRYTQAGADARLPGAAGVKQQRSTRRDADIAYRKEHGAGGLTVAVNAKALTRCVILLYHGLELRKLGWIARTIAHAQGRHGSIRIGRLPCEATDSVKKSKRAQCAH